MNQMTLKSCTTLGLALVILLALPGSAIAAKGGIPGPPPGGETPNNLSLPAVLTGSAITTGHSWNPPAEPLFGVHYSWGCEGEESVEQWSYPNTTCAELDPVNDEWVYLTAEECTDPSRPGPCVDEFGVAKDLYPIYWQKVDANEWSADAEGALGTTPLAAFRTVDFVDWGDALEAVPWSERSVIRVETQPYHSKIEGFLPWVNYCAEAAVFDPEVECKVGLQMWHASGQGITEHWGVRADAPGPGAVSFNYDSPFQIIHSSNARLNFAKLVEETATCPEPGGNPNDPPPVGPFFWNGSGWDDEYFVPVCQVFDQPYTVELSVGGKYVFGYNLRMNDVDLADIEGCAEYEKTGYYRLTFYTPPDNPLAEPDVIFDDELAENVAPPYIPSEVRALPRNGNFNTALAEPPPEPVELTESDDPTADDRLFRPVIDTLNNLTYIDICIIPKTQGGGGGGGGGKPKK